MSDTDTTGYVVFLFIIGILCFIWGAVWGGNRQRRIYCEHKNMIHQKIDDVHFCQEGLKLHPIEWLHPEV